MCQTVHTTLYTTTYVTRDTRCVAAVVTSLCMVPPVLGLRLFFGRDKVGSNLGIWKLSRRILGNDDDNDHNERQKE